MVDYWIALVSLYKDALERQHKQWWYCKPGRDTPRSNDKVVIYHPGSTPRAKSEKKRGVKDKHRFKFIGNFTVGDSTLASAHAGGIVPGNKVARIKEKKIIWSESEFVDIHPIKEKLEGVSEAMKKYGEKRWGFYFFNKTWIEIEKSDYDLILSKRSGVR